MDGAIARLTHTTSDFGKELDSLADVVTFGVAPGILAWMWGFFCLPASLDADLRDKLVQFGAIVAFAFLTAGRLPPGAFQYSAQSSAEKSGTPGAQVFCRYAHPWRSRLPCRSGASSSGVSRAGLVELALSGWATSFCAPS